MSSKADKRFLIRSSGHILGPFLKEEVIDLIKKGKISVFDEVAEPYTIWLYLQDHTDFKQIVHSINMQSRLVNFLSSVSTKISQISKQKDGKTVTETKTTEENLSPLEKQTASEVSVEAVKPIQISTPSKSEYRSEEESEEIIRKKISLFVNWGWMMIILAVLTVGAYIFYREFYKPMQKKQAIKEDLNSKGFMFYKARNFKKALSFFDPAYSNELLSDEEKILYASILIQQNKISKAVVVKNEISNNSAVSQGKRKLLESLLDYHNKDYSSAKKKLESIIKDKKKSLIISTSLKNKSLYRDINTIQDTARWNLALFYWKDKKDNKSINYLNQLDEKGIKRDIISYLRALNLLSQNNLTELEEHLNNNLDESIEFKPELYFLSAYIYMKKKDKQKLKSQITKLLNSDPFLYQEYGYNSFIAKNTLFNWSYLFNYCREIFKSYPQDNLFKALYGFCYLKANNFKKAGDYIKQLQNMDTKNPLFLSLYAYLLMIENTDITKMRQVLNEINYPLAIQTKLTLPFVLKARFLEKQKDWSEALEMWKEIVFSINNTYLSGLAGVAFTSYQLGDSNAEDFYIQKTLEIYPYYIKILSINK